MRVFTESEADEARLFSELVHTNPFTPARLEVERALLGDDFEELGPVWSLDPNEDRERKNLTLLRVRAEALVRTVRGRLLQRPRCPTEALLQYQDLLLYTLYERFEDPMYRAIVVPTVVEVGGALFDTFEADFRAGLEPAWAMGLPELSAGHAFAMLWQLRRAFHFIHRRILGGSQVVAGLRAAVWQSVFTHDLRRYRRSLYRRMHEIPTLILGPSGTGKELVAAALGASRYIPFDVAKRRFDAPFEGLFRPIHLAALSESLIEAELFGHEKGAFTGAHLARAGLLEGEGQSSTVFLDEIGEVPASMQVKLLRVLQTRRFHRVGGGEARVFEGKVVAATHRDLAAQIRAGHFREDLYYRLCADVVHTCGLAQQLGGDPGELRQLVAALSLRIVDPEDVPALTDEVVQVIERELGLDYSWPGNMRELEQCIRNVLVRGAYRGADLGSQVDPYAQLMQEIRAGALTADDLLSRYATLVYAQEQSYEGTARRLLIDRRTVKRRVDLDRLAALNKD